MRKALAIVLIMLLLFSSIGYYGFFEGVKLHHNSKMIKRLDQSDYAGAHIILLKIPISIPYAIESEDFVRVDGTFEHNGEFYRRVSQRLWQDTLQIQCIKDLELSRMNNAWVSYVKTFADSHSDHSSPSTKGSNYFSKDYLQYSFGIEQSSAGNGETLQHYIPISFLSDTYIPSLLRPPEVS